MVASFEAMEGEFQEKQPGGSNGVSELSEGSTVPLSRNKRKVSMFRGRWKQHRESPLTPKLKYREWAHLKRKAQYLRRESNRVRAQLAALRQRERISDSGPEAPVVQRRASRFEKLSDEDVQVLTGMQSKSMIEALAESIRMGEENAKRSGYSLGVLSVKALPVEDQVLVTLTKLRWNQPFAMLKIYWKTPASALQRIVNNMIDVLHQLLHTAMQKRYGLPTPGQNEGFVPPQFYGVKNCRLIVDSTNIRIRKPEDDLFKRSCYSKCQEHHLLKILVGVAPTGLLCFTSELFPDRMTEEEIVKKSGLETKLDPGDLILLGKKFQSGNSSSMAMSVHATTFSGSDRRLDVADFRGSCVIAKGKLIVERAIERYKLYEILNDMPHQYQSKALVLVQLCAALINYEPFLFDRERDPELACVDS